MFPGNQSGGQLVLSPVCVRILAVLGAGPRAYGEILEAMLAPGLGLAARSGAISGAVRTLLDLKLMEKSPEPPEDGAAIPYRLTDAGLGVLRAESAGVGRLMRMSIRSTIGSRLRPN